jgi:hypothetical protein
MDLWKILKYQISRKSPQVGTELIKTGEQADTDTTKLIVVFRNFAKSPKNGNEGQDVTTIAHELLVWRPPAVQEVRWTSGLVITAFIS